MKGTNLRIVELRTSLANVINEANLPIGINTMILTEILSSLKTAESTVVEAERKAYEKELKEKEGVKNEEIQSN